MAVALVGGAFLSSFLAVLFDRMASRQVVDFIHGRKTTKGLLSKLKIKLLSVNTLVDDADRKQIRSETVRKWLDELRHVLYAAGDLLDEINTEALRCKLAGTTSQVQNLNLTFFDEFDKSLEPKIVEIIDALQLIVEESCVLGLTEGVEDRGQVSIRKSTSLVNESDVYGRNADKEAIIEFLLSDDATQEKIGVIPIVGMGGIGKTTLAQLAYNDDEVKKHFNLQAWICVSEESDILTVTTKIYASLTSQPCGITDLDPLQIMLKEALTNQKFLFVLDDVWKANYIDWDVLRRPFEYGAHGSKIIVTTRIRDVACMMGTFPPHHLMQITEEDCWSLFAKHALKNAEILISHPNLAVIGREIVRKCDGLPLAAKSLGGLLRNELKTEEWRNVLQSDIWDLLDKETIIIPALWLSYYYLPSHLKRCFAYCSIYPKDYMFTKSELVLLWMAEDLVQPQKNKKVEEVGEVYFDNLVSRSFFQLQPKRKWPFFSIYNEAHFTMHDLINDLAKFVSGEFCCRLEGGDSLSMASKTRHLSYMQRNHHSLDRFEALLFQAKYLHTFLPFPIGNGRKLLAWDHKVFNGLMPNLQCLRLLNLSWYQIREVPNSIGELKHLRHLDLSFTQIEKLPDTMCVLYNLQTLLLLNCKSLVELPTNLGRLINLRRLGTSGTNLKRMPPNMGKLKELQLLPYFVLDKHTGHYIVELKKLEHLSKTLVISGLDNIVRDEDALEANIMSGKKDLDKLIMRWGDGITEDPAKDGELLQKLQPHTNVKDLVIESYGGIRFAGWLGDTSFSNLSSIELRDCKHCSLLPSLGQLSSLRKLHIFGLNNVVEIGPEFYGNDTCGVKPFRSLQELTFEDMLEWQEWSYVGGNKEAGIFINLGLLRLKNCPKLTEIWPVDNLPKLEWLQLWGLKSFSGSLSHPESKCLKLLSLGYLQIFECPKFVCFPDGGIDAPKLNEIHIWDCEKLRSLPEQMHTLLPCLHHLKLLDCPELESFPQGGLPSTLESLEFHCYRKLFVNRGEWGLKRLSSLRKLKIQLKKCGEEMDSSFPEEGLLPTATPICLFSEKFVYF